MKYVYLVESVYSDCVDGMSIDVYHVASTFEKAARYIKKLTGTKNNLIKRNPNYWYHERDWEFGYGINRVEIDKGY